MIDAAVRQFREQRFVFLPGTLTPSEIAAITSAADRIYRERDALARAGALPAAAAYYFERRTIPLVEVMASEDVILQQLLREPIASVAADYLGPSMQLRSDSLVRTVKAPELDKHLPFHQDETVAGCKIVNVWIALSPCGIDAPGLELVRGSSARLWEPTGPADHAVKVESARLSEADVLGAFGADALFRPCFATGDVIVFSGATIHRTHATATMTEPRTSAELRLAPALTPSGAAPAP